MIMLQGAPGANISQYGSYVSNCTLGQTPYKVPVNSLSDVQLYINIGATQPDAIQYQLIHTCGAGGTVVLPNPDYVIGQDTNDNFYGVFKNFTGATPVCFVIAITLSFGDTDTIYFSEEYCIENNCNNLTQIRGCYGNLDNKISYDAEGIYFGTPLGAGAVGDLDIVYKHETYLRKVEVYRSAIKNTFKQGRIRNFRTEKETIHQFIAEPVPDWFLSYIDAVFFRGEVFVDSIKYLVSETEFEIIDECKRMWKPWATFRKTNYQSFSCEADPCGGPVADCCEPTGINATVTFSDNIITCCDPQIIYAEVESES